MDSLDKLGLMADLVNLHCVLNHGPGIEEKIQAVDYIAIPLGDIETKKHKDDLIIPICAECAEGMEDPKWVLIYCLECEKSQWIYKPWAKKEYNGNLILTVGCLKCVGQLRQIFVM
jgi:hypothetical protein